MISRSMPGSIFPVLYTQCTAPVLNRACSECALPGRAKSGPRHVPLSTCRLGCKVSTVRMLLVLGNNDGGEFWRPLLVEMGVGTQRRGKGGWPGPLRCVHHDCMALYQCLLLIHTVWETGTAQYEHSVWCVFILIYIHRFLFLI